MWFAELRIGLWCLDAPESVAHSCSLAPSPRFEAASSAHVAPPSSVTILPEGAARATASGRRTGGNRDVARFRAGIRDAARRHGM